MMGEDYPTIYCTDMSIEMLVVFAQCSLLMSCRLMNINEPFAQHVLINIAHHFSTISSPSEITKLLLQPMPAHCVPDHPVFSPKSVKLKNTGSVVPCT